MIDEEDKDACEISLSTTCWSNSYRATWKECLRAFFLPLLVALTAPSYIDEQRVSAVDLLPTSGTGGAASAREGLEGFQISDSIFNASAVLVRVNAQLSMRWVCFHDIHGAPKARSASCAQRNGYSFVYNSHLK